MHRYTHQFKTPEVNLLPSTLEVSWKPQPRVSTGLAKTPERLLNEAVGFPSFTRNLEIHKLQSRMSGAWTGGQLTGGG